VLETVVTILTPFGAFVAAEWVHLSGVLAIVVAGLYVGIRAAALFAPETRRHAVTFWNVATFVLNGMIFLLVGLQMPRVLRGVAEYGVLQLSLYALAVCVTVLLTCWIWLLLGVGLERLLRLPERLTTRSAAVLGWAGMRGAISLAAVLALPAATLDGAPFPHRDLLAFLVARVVLLSLVLQSLTLPRTAKAQVGGKLAQLGQRLVDGVASSMTAEFFRRLESELLTAGEGRLEPKLEPREKEGGALAPHELGASQRSRSVWLWVSAFAGLLVLLALLWAT
jgi:NhaP-type Na+/H+ or K+/H+ antiporter